MTDNVEDEEDDAIQDKDKEAVHTVEFLLGWKCREEYEEHDFFVSYRVASDRLLANELGLKLCKPEYRGAHVKHCFLDRECLVTGTSWQEGFLQGLLRARVIVLLCSIGALERVKRADKKADNMLLEWEIALDKLQRSESYVLPVLVGQQRTMITSDGHSVLAYRRFLDEFDLSLAEFPDTYHVHSQSPKRHTIRGLVRTLLNLQAVARWPDDVGDIARDASEMHARSMRELQRLKQPSETVSLAIGAAIRRITTILKPLDFEAERKRLRQAHQEGTRMWLLDEIFIWLKEEDSRVFWLKGDPGVGKSVMAGVVANALQGELHLGAAFFCKHDDVSRRDASKLIHTMACGLAHWDHRIAFHLEKFLRAHPHITSQSVPEQFAGLVLEPLSAVPDSDNTVVLVVDAIDECGEKHSRKDILNVLGVECAKLPSFVKLFVTSRMEEDIVAAFANLEPYKLLDPRDRNNLHDLELKAQSMLEEQLSHHAISQIELLDLVDMIVKKSAGVFVWLTMAEPFLRECNDVEKMRTTIVDLPSNVEGLYEGTLMRAYERCPALADIVPLVIIAQEPLTPATIAGFLGFTDLEVTSALDVMSGIVKADQVVKVRHKSLTDFITNPERCKEKSLLVSLPSGNAKLAAYCLTSMNNLLRPNPCNLATRCLNSEIPKLAEGIQTSIPHIIYAAEFWLDHVLHSGDEDTEHLLPLVGAFLTTKLLDWFEVLSLLGQEHVNGAIFRLWDLHLWLKKHPDTEQYQDLAYDAWRFLQDFHSLIHGSAFHIRCTSVECVAISAAETYLVTCSVDKTAKVYDTRSGTRLRTLEDAHPLSYVCISPDETFCVTVSQHRTITVWNIATGAVVKRIEDTSAAFSIAISPDGKRIVTGSVKESAKIWDLASGTLLRELVGHTDAVKSVAVSRDGVHIVTGSDDGTVRMWNMDTGMTVMVFEGHTKAVEAVAVSDDGKWVVTGSADATARVWDPSTGSALQTLEGHVTAVEAVAISGNGLIVTGSRDNTAKVWDGASGALIKTLYRHGLAVWTVAINRDGTRVVTGSADRTTKVWDISSGSSSETEYEPEDFAPVTFIGKSGTYTIHTVGVDSSGRRMVTGSVDGIVTVWDMETHSILWSRKEHQDWVTATVISRDGRHIITGSNDTTAKMWDADTGSVVCTLEGHKYRVESVAICDAGEFIVTGSFDASAKVWDTTGSLKWTLSGHKDCVKAVAVDNREALVVTGSTDRTARVWDLLTGKLINILDLSDIVYSVAINPGWIITRLGVDGGVLKRWDIEAYGGAQSKTGRRKWPFGRTRSSSSLPRPRAGSESSLGEQGNRSDDGLGLFGGGFYTIKRSGGWVTGQRSVVSKPETLGWLPHNYRGEVRATKTVVVVFKDDKRAVFIRGWS
ncbi:hypothetical protein HDV00_001591 [Rhizophlyctis rosea]|nr:hypothetical protein HDV00_001591 [Rhizophlyctis rosea]